MKDLVCNFIRQHQLAVVSTIGIDGKPESALVGIAVSGNLDIIFDTLKTSRKYSNILANHHVAIVVGWDNETTLQYEGIAEVLGNDNAADNFRRTYYAAWPDGLERAETWPGLVHIRVTPKWIRYSNFNEPVMIREMDL
ncbi:MAG: pyridoxamine 5'-phosphate oxidase family protein [Sphingobacteriales bacterium]